MGVVKAMPADKFSFAPSATTFAAAQGAQFTGVRTFAQQATHVAQANFFFYLSLSGMKPDTDVASDGEADVEGRHRAALGDSFTFAHGRSRRLRRRMRSR